MAGCSGRFPIESNICYTTLNSTRTERAKIVSATKFLNLHGFSPARRFLSMSDHWNGIANLLGTPSLNPINKKESTSKSTKPSTPNVETLPSAVSPTAAIETEVESTLEPSKAKAEPSRLRSSWDAVAQFFGVSTPEPVQAQKSTPAVDVSEIRKPELSSSRKGKPSMWGAELIPEAAKTSEPLQRTSSEPTEVSKPERSDLPVRSGRPERTARPERSDRPERPRRDGRDRSDQEGRSREDTPVVNRDSEETTRELSPRREERAGSIDPERRSSRRPPRRGRSDESSESTVDSDSTRQLDVPSDAFGSSESVGRSRSPNESSSRDQRDSRRSRNPEGDSTARKPRESGPERSESVESSDRGQERGAERPERAPRPSRDGGRDRPSQDRNRDNSTRDQAPRESSDRPRTDRSAARSEAGPQESGNRSERTSNRSESSRPERPRGARDGRDRPASRDNANRESTNRDSVSREPTNRDSRGDSRQRSSESKSTPKQGFGAGLSDDEVFFEDRDDRQLDSRDDFVELDVEGEVAERPLDSDEKIDDRPKRRRGRGRGRRGERSKDDSTERSEGISEDRNDDSDSQVSRTKIPSWEEAIGALVAVNMENHAKNPGNHRHSRGRNPRRDR
jgi:hypothetical protein